MDLASALETEIAKAQRTNHLKKGFREVCQLITRQRAVLCVKSEDTEYEIQRIIRHLCSEFRVPLFTIEDRHQLGRWAGQGNRVVEGEITRVARCCCVALSGWDRRSEEARFLVTTFNEVFGLTDNDPDAPEGDDVPIEVEEDEDSSSVEE